MNDAALDPAHQPFTSTSGEAPVGGPVAPVGRPWPSTPRHKGGPITAKAWSIKRPGAPRSTDRSGPVPVGDAPPSARHRGGIGRGDDGMNLFEGNDFTQAAITTNTGLREGFPVDKQAWPPDYYPSVDDPL